MILNARSGKVHREVGLSRAYALCRRLIAGARCREVG
jgi:hypothetical protein